MKITKRQLRKIIKEEISAQKREVTEMVDPAMVAAAQQAFTLSPESFKFIWSLVKALPGIPAKYRSLKAIEDRKEIEAASQDDPKLAQLLDALGEFSKNTGGTGFSDDEKASMQRVYRGDEGAGGRELE